MSLSNKPKPNHEKGTEFKLNVPIEASPYVNQLNVEERKWIKDFTDVEVLPFILRKHKRIKHP